MTARLRLSAWPLMAALVVAGPLRAGDAIMVPGGKLEKAVGATVFRLYGQVNIGVLGVDDGIQTTNFGLVSNSNYVNRLGLEFVRPLDSDWTLGGVAEIGYTPRASDSVNLDNMDTRDFNLSRSDLRYLDLILQSRRWGTIYAGQGNMASEASTKADLSGTRVIDYSDVADTAGGQLIRTSDGGFSGLEIGDVFKEYDGLGRQLRLRYDLPDFASGFGGRVSFGRNALDYDTTNTWDIAGTYAAKNKQFQTEAVLAWAWAGDDTTILSGSFSALHLASGLNLTIASARQDKSGAVSGYTYVKAGYLGDLIDWGKTALVVDLYSGADIGVAGSSSRSQAVSVVQYVDRADLQLYATLRQYDYADAADSYEDVQAVMAGAMWQF